MSLTTSKFYTPSDKYYLPPTHGLLSSSRSDTKQQIPQWVATRFKAEHPHCFPPTQFEMWKTKAVGRERHAKVVRSRARRVEEEREAKKREEKRKWEVQRVEMERKGEMQRERKIAREIDELKARTAAEVRKEAKEARWTEEKARAAKKKEEREQQYQGWKAMILEKDIDLDDETKVKTARAFYATEKQCLTMYDEHLSIEHQQNDIKRQYREEIRQARARLENDAVKEVYWLEKDIEEGL